MALPALQHDQDELPAPRSRFARAISKVASLYQDGVQHGKLNGNCDGISHGREDGDQQGFHDDQSNGLVDDGELVFVVQGDAVWALPPGYRPPPTAKEYAAAFVAFLQGLEPLPGRWISAHSLQHELYPLFLQQIGWPPRPWLGVAHRFKKLGGVKKRQRDRRWGSDRVGGSPTEYFVPRKRGYRAHDRGA